MPNQRREKQPAQKPVARVTDEQVIPLVAEPV